MVNLRWVVEYRRRCEVPGPQRPQHCGARRSDSTARGRGGRGRPWGQLAGGPDSAADRLCRMPAVTVLQPCSRSCHDRRNPLYFNGYGYQPVAGSDAETIRASGAGAASCFGAKRPRPTRPWTAPTGRTSGEPGTPPYRPKTEAQGDPGPPPAHAWDGSAALGAEQAPC